LVRRGAEVQANVELYETDDLTVLARASVTAPPEDVSVFADSLALQLLHEIWRSGDPPSPNLSGVTTSSPEALRHFLDGEKALVETRWDDAEEAYARAFHADSTFWLASVQYSYVVKVWTLPPDPDTGVMRGFHGHIGELPQSYQSLLDVAGRYYGVSNYLYADSSWPSALEAYGRLASQYPEYWHIAFDYADDMSHWGPLFGFTGDDVLASWNRLFARNPELEGGNLEEGWRHALVISFDRDPQFTDRALGALGRITGWGEEVPARYRLALAPQQGGLDTLLADSVAQEFLATPSTIPHGRFVFENAMFGVPRVTVEVGRRVLRGDASADMVYEHGLGIAYGWAARGAWDSAMIAADEVVKRVSNPDRLLHRYRLAAVGAWLGLVPPEEARTRRPDSAVVSLTHWQEWRTEVNWLDGILAFTLGDSGGLRSSRDNIPVADLTEYPLVSLLAFQFVLQGDPRRAADTLAHIQLDRTVRQGQHPPVSNSVMIGVNRLATAKWLVAEGETARARKLLQWHVRDPVWGSFGRAKAVFASLAYLELARIEQAEGRDNLAREYHRQFLRRYDRPMEQHRHLVDEAKAALASLTVSDQ
jgi:tetratricopeptide (TPR) repeat protein